MKVVIKKLDDLKPAERNVRIHGKKQIQELAKSVEQFGIIRPIVIDEENTILAGNGLYEALRYLELKEAPTVQCNDLTENEKKKLMLADNKVFSLGSDNFDVIDEFMLELDGDFDIAGFDEDILAELYAPSEDVEFTDDDYDEIEKRKEQAEQYQAGEVEVPQNIQEAKQEAQKRKFVVCPNCNEKIYID